MRKHLKGELSAHVMPGKSSQHPSSRPCSPPLGKAGRCYTRHSFLCSQSSRLPNKLQLRPKSTPVDWVPGVLSIWGGGGEKTERRS